MTYENASGNPRFKIIAFGYLAAVAASTLAATITMIAFDPSTLGYVLPFAGVGAGYAFVSGAPGFALTWLLARRLSISSGFYFIIAGALNAALALLIVDGSLRSEMLTSDLGIASMIGGAAGGLAFWYVARRLGAFTASR